MQLLYLKRGKGGERKKGRGGGREKREGTVEFE